MNGVAIGALLIGEDYERFSGWLESQAWATIEEIRVNNAHLDSDEIYEEATRIVQAIRKEQHAARAAS